MGFDKKTSIKKIDKYIAAKLYTAISFDTGCFKFSNVKSHTMIAAADLLKYQIPFEDINRRLFRSFFSRTAQSRDGGDFLA